MLTSKGYIRKWYGDRLRMEHDVVWERNLGAICYVPPYSRLFVASYSGVRQEESPTL
jgi:uncharacterized RmlC-like cupin family protein